MITIKSWPERLGSQRTGVYRDEELMGVYYWNICVCCEENGWCPEEEASLSVKSELNRDYSSMFLKDIIEALKEAEALTTGLPIEKTKGESE